MGDTYFAAVDGGGSSTVFSLYHIGTQVTTYHTAGPTNYKVVGEERTRQNLVEAFKLWLRQSSIDLSQIVHMVFGISGLDSEGDERYYRQLIQSLDLSEDQYTLCNDAEIAFYTTGKLPGIILVAGTGSIAFAMTANGQYRSGGWGSPFSDLGSGVWLGNKVLTELLKYCDGGGKEEKVYSACLEKAGVLDYRDFPMAVTDSSFDQIALFAELVVTYADKGDVFCQGMVQEAGSELAFLVESAAHKAGFLETQFYDCVLSGGLFNSLYFKQSLVSQLKNSSYEWLVKHYAGLPVDGGIHLAQLKKNRDKQGGALCI